MKKYNLLKALVMAIAMLCNANSVFAQSTSAGALSFPNQPITPWVDYLGWDNTVGAPVDIKHEAAQPIMFFTNAGAGTFTNMRMHILGTYGATGGLIGIGDMGSHAVPFIPRSLLHLHQNGSTSFYQQFTNGNTGTGATDGFQVGLLDNPLGAGGVGAVLIQQETDPILFYNKTSNIGGPIYLYQTIEIGERNQRVFGGLGTLKAMCMSISRGQPLYSPSGTIQPITNLISTLNIGTNPPGSITTWAGNRPWMDVGTYANFSTDNIYTGLKDEGPDLLGGTQREADAIIDWGDNFDGAHTNTESIQNLRFIFTAPGNDANVWTNGPHAAFNGLEVARMCSNGNIGIGDFYNNGPAASVIQPVAKLEILDGRDITQNYPNVSLNRPHLRLTFTQATTANPTTTGIWTDFQTTSIGDLYIHPNYQTGVGAATFGNVGINTSIPGNTLEINKNIPYVVGATGFSGLRFTDMRSGSLAGATNGKVLSVDASGDVILVDDDVAGGMVSSCTATSSGDLGFITKWTNLAGTNREICRTHGIYEDPISNNVGFNTTTPQYDLIHFGTSLYGNFGDPATFSYETFNTTTTLPLAVKTSDEDNGLYIFSNEPPVPFGTLAPTDRLNLFADRNGWLYHHSRADFTVFRDKNNGNRDLMGFIPDLNLVTIKSDVTGTVIPVLYSDAKLYTEANPNDFPAHQSCIIGNNLTTAWSDNDTCIAVEGYSYGEKQNGAQGRNAGGMFMANESSENYGLIAMADKGNTQTKAKFNTGGLFRAGNASNPAYAVLARVVNPAFDWAGWFSGMVYCPAGVFTPSDSSIKDNITPYNNSISIIDSLHTYSYTYDTTGYPQLGLQQGTQIGFMANEMEAVLPNLVRNTAIPGSDDGSGNPVYIKTINSTGLIPLLWNMSVNLKHDNDSIKNVLATLQQTVAACCNNVVGTRSANPSTIELKNLATLQLLQNDPNPWSESTWVRWNIGAAFKQATIYFYDNSGAQINQYKVENEGKGELQVFGSKLSNGVYTYTLVVDGKIIDSKKMMKAQ